MWFLEILQNEKLKKELIDKCNEGPGPEDMQHVYRTVMEKYKTEKGVEGNKGIFARIQLLESQLAEELTAEMLDEI